MRVGDGQRQYEWIDGWARIRDAGRKWAHPGIAVALSGEVVTAHPSEPILLVFDPDGTLLHEAPTELVELHGIDVDAGGDVWVADVGTKRRIVGADFETDERPEGGRVVRLGRDGRIEAELARPDGADGSTYSPTAVVVDDEGGIWVADGYGSSQSVFRFDAGGDVVTSLTGDEGAGRFDCPHGLLLDRRKGEPELYVSDRANGRIQVYDLDGRYKRSIVGGDVLRLPTEMAVAGDALLVTDLLSRVTVFDGNDSFVCHLGHDAGAPGRDAWPNARDERGNLVRPSLEPGLFNSPHGIAADADGNVYVTEWLIGGRYTKLAPV